ncbi:MAG TPA: barstar family protein [Amycolatopsis sp.]
MTAEVFMHASGDRFSWGHHFSDTPESVTLPDWARFANPGSDTQQAVYLLSNSLLETGSGAHSVLIQGRRCKTTKGLLSCWGDALEFPSYYGGNLDSFNECMADLVDLEDGNLGSAFKDRVGRPAEALLIVIQEADILLEDEEESLTYKFLSMLDFVATGRSQDSSTLRKTADLRVLLLAETTSRERLLGAFLRLR